MKKCLALLLVGLITGVSFLPAENGSNGLPNPYGSLSELPQDDDDSNLPKDSPYESLSKIPPEV